MLLYHRQEATGHTEQRLVGGRKENMEENMLAEFRAVLIAILDYLEHGEADRAIAYIHEALDSK